MPIYRELPSASSGYVYMLTSLSSPEHVVYIGETSDLKSCLRDHNTGYGAKETSNTCLHPWGLYAFIVGFEANSMQSCQKELVERWRAAVTKNMHVNTVYTIGKLLAEEYGKSGVALTTVKCGQIM
jgi:predicted GIY-YIG superfamily endonuclease